MKESRRWGESREWWNRRREDGERRMYKKAVYGVGRLGDMAAALTVAMVMSLYYMVAEISTQNLNQRLTATLIFFRDCKELLRQ